MAFTQEDLIPKIVLTTAISEKNKVAISPLNTNPGSFSFVTKGKWDSGHRQSSLEQWDIYNHRFCWQLYMEQNSWL